MPSEKYFLDRQGVRTERIAGRPGAGHIEIAQATGQLDPNSDVYRQMFALGYVRVLETETEVNVDAPNVLTGSQRRFLNEKVAAGKRVTINSAEFVGSRG